MAQKNASIVYNVNGMSFNTLKTAETATKNVSKELANRFRNETLSLSQFAKALSNWNDATATNFKTYALGLKSESLNDNAKVFDAIREKYPYKNADGKLVKSKSVSKGIFTTEIITLFEESILDAIQFSWLTNRKPIILPKSYTKDTKGNISEIEKSQVEKAIADKTEKRENAKVVAIAKTNLFEELVKRASALNSCKKLAEYETAKSAILETLSAINDF